MAKPTLAYRTTVTILTILMLVLLFKIGGVIASILMFGLGVWLLRSFGSWKRAVLSGMPSKNALESRSNSSEIEVRSRPNLISPEQCVSSDQVWIKPGESIKIHGHEFDGGFLYVGENLSSIGGRYLEEPALINPKYKVQDILTADCHVRQLSYWPSYSQASPKARTAYLHWLLKGKKDPHADIGYVFLYYHCSAGFLKTPD